MSKTDVKSLINKFEKKVIPNPDVIDVSNMNFKDKMAFWKKKERENSDVSKKNQVMPESTTAKQQKQQTNVIRGVNIKMFVPVVTNTDARYDNIIAEYATHVNHLDTKFYIDPLDLQIMNEINGLYRLSKQKITRKISAKSSQDEEQEDDD